MGGKFACNLGHVKGRIVMFGGEAFGSQAFGSTGDELSTTGKTIPGVVIDDICPATALAGTTIDEACDC